MDHFPNLPRDPEPAKPVKAAPAAAAAARAAKSGNLMYVWIGLAVASFGALAYWGVTRPNPSEADPVAGEAYIPEAKTPAQRAQEDALTNMVKRLKEQEEASRVIVLEGPKREPERDVTAAVPKPAKEMFIKFTPSTQPSTRPTTIGGRTKPFLAPDVAEDGSFFGQIDKATGKPKTVYSSNQRRYIVDNGVDFAERDASGAVIERSQSSGAGPVGGTVFEAERPKGQDYIKEGSNGSTDYLKTRSETRTRTTPR